MNKQNTDKLYKDFLELFYEKDLSIQESCMPWGFECEDGWFDLIYKCCEEITSYCNKNKIPIIHIGGVKQKFGSLRIDWNWPNPLDQEEHFKNHHHFEKIDALIERFEKMSVRVCESCGKIGHIDYSYGWLIALCDDCRKRYLR